MLTELTVGSGQDENILHTDAELSVMIDERDFPITDPGVVELGCGEAPDDRSDTRVDIADVAPADLIWNLEDTPWPIEDDSVDGVILTHGIEHLEDASEAMHEISRILKPGGWAEITVPVGGHWFRDPTHQQFWTYSTPTYHSSNKAGEWDYYFDLPLVLVNRSFTALWFMAPLLSKLSPLLRLVARYYPGDWVCFTPWVAGELRSRFEKEK